MEEGRWAARLMSEIHSARAGIAASYLSLWRRGGRLADEEPDAPVPHDASEVRPATPAETEQA
jgi:hypothetical protein